MGTVRCARRIADREWGTYYNEMLDVSVSVLRSGEFI